jgi:hypothetical protein
MDTVQEPSNAECYTSSPESFRHNNQNNKVKENVMGRECSIHCKKRNGYGILLRKPEGKKPLGRFKRNWRIILNRS